MPRGLNNNPRTEATQLDIGIGDPFGWILLSSLRISLRMSSCQLRLASADRPKMRREKRELQPGGLLLGESVALKSSNLFPFILLTSSG